MIEILLFLGYAQIFVQLVYISACFNTAEARMYVELLCTLMYG